MHPVHVRCDDEKSKCLIDSRGNADVGVVEHCRRVQGNFENQHRDGRHPQQNDKSELDGHGHQNFQRMKPQACGDVKILIRVMYQVQPPEKRHKVENHMLNVDRQIQQQYGYQHDKPGR